MVVIGVVLKLFSHLEYVLLNNEEPVLPVGDGARVVVVMGWELDGVPDATAEVPSLAEAVGRVVVLCPLSVVAVGLGEFEVRLVVSCRFS